MKLLNNSQTYTSRSCHVISMHLMKKALGNNALLIKKSLH